MGTAHVSEKSINEVNRIIEETRPDIVAVELCPGRYQALMGEAVQEIAIKDILKSGKLYFYLAQWLLAYVQKKIGANVGVEPGAEMMSAIEKAREIDADVALVDRDIQVTLQRFWSQMKLREKLRMFTAIVSAIGSVGDEMDVDLDTITDEDIVSQLIDELRSFSPRAAHVLVDERDAYIANNLLNMPPDKRIVAVVGAGHRKGVQKYLDNPQLIPPMEGMEHAPRKRRIGFMKIFSVLLVAFILFMFLMIILSGVPLNLILLAFGFWILINGTLSAAGAAIARGHPLSIATAFCVAWLTSLNPMIAAGWFAGLVEAWVRNPTTGDAKRLLEVESVDDLLSNNMFRILLVAALANLGSMIGTFLGAYVVLDVTGLQLGNILTGIFTRI